MLDLKSERCASVANEFNFALLRDHFFNGTAHASYLLVLCKFIQLKVSQKSERCEPTANFALLRDPLLGDTGRVSYLLVLCKMIQLQVD